MKPGDKVIVTSDFPNSAPVKAGDRGRLVDKAGKGHGEQSWRVKCKNNTWFIEEKHLVKVPKPTTNKETREESGRVDGNRLEGLLYMLMRDHLPAGKLESIVMDLEKVKVCQFTNGWLAEYAKNLARRIRA